MKRRAFLAACGTVPLLCTGGGSAAATVSSLVRCGPGHFVANRQGPPAVVQAYFLQRSYAPGQTARLVVVRAPPGTSMRVFHADVVVAASQRPDTITGAPVSEPVPVRRGTTTVAIGEWQSGLYFAQLTAGGSVGYAPLIVRAVSGENTVAVVLPTNTWQAENLLDQDRDGYGDTWYTDPRVNTVSLARPFLNRGVPPRLSLFPYWMSEYGKQADFLSDDDLDAFSSGAELARRYNLIVFAGHEEYATAHMFDLMARYRDLGDHLAFLSSNSFFYRVVRLGNSITCIGEFRDEGRPEAALIGVQYLDWNHNLFRSKPYLVVGVQSAPWFFAGTGLRNGKRFGYAYGVEIDGRTPASPRSIAVLAQLPNIFGPGRTAEMTYYVAPSGAKVFAAGAFNFDSSQNAVTDRLLLNLWDYLDG